MEKEDQDRIAAMVRRAAQPPVMTLTEQKLCRMWLQASHTGEWWELFQQLADIRDVLQAFDPDDYSSDGAAMFHHASEQALARVAYEIWNKDNLNGWAAKKLFEVTP